MSPSQKLKIGVVCYPTFGGSGVVATELGKAFAAKGHDVHFITYQEPARLNTFDPNIYYHEVRALQYSLFKHTPYEIALASKLVNVAKFEELDLLHVHYAIPHASAAYMARMILRDEGIELPFITTLHGTDITLVGKDMTYSPVVAFSINHSDAVTAVSDHLKQETKDHFNINKHIEVIPNFIDFDRFKKTDKEHFRRAIAPNGERILIHASNFRKVKRVDDVVKVYDQVCRKIPSKLLLIGDGPERHIVEQQCRELGNCADVRFLGKQDAVEELLAIGDLFLLPSGSESFGLAALEAMACEVPVLSSNTGGLPELNVHGYSGYLSDVGDVDDMAKHAIHMLEDDERLDQFRKNAFLRAKEFEIENILPRYEQLYRSVVEEFTVKAAHKQQ